MPILRHATTERRTAPAEGERPKGSGGGTCDLCDRKLNSYNRDGRCGACCHSHGWPNFELPDPTGDKEAAHPRPGHADHCECAERRRMMVNHNGDPVPRPDKRGFLYVIDVSCPTCGEERAVKYGGHTHYKGQYCHRDYLVVCRSCHMKARHASGSMKRTAKAKQKFHTPA